MGIYHHGALLSTSAPCTNSLPVTPQEPFENRGPRLTPQTTSMHLLSPWQALVYQPLVVTPSTYSNLAILLAMVIWILWDIICSCNKTFSIVSHDLTVMSLSSNEEFLTVLFITYLRGPFCRAECRTSAWMGVCWVLNPWIKKLWCHNDRPVETVANIDDGLLHSWHLPRQIWAPNSPVATIVWSGIWIICSKQLGHSKVSISAKTPIDLHTNSPQTMSNWSLQNYRDVQLIQCDSSFQRTCSISGSGSIMNMLAWDPSDSLIHRENALM